MDYRSIDVRDRRIVFFGSEEMVRDILQHGLKRGKFAELPPLITAHLPTLATTIAIGKCKSIFNIVEDLVLGTSQDSTTRTLPYLVFDVVGARDQFSFPVNHPTDGGVYACCDAEPYLYVPMSAFHRYMYEAKMSAFCHLCSNLGVKTCRVVYAEEDGRDVTASANLGVPTQAGVASGGVEAGLHSNKQGKAAIYIKFRRPKSPPIEYRSGWMNGEPTWQMMQTLRLEGNLEHYIAEFDYSSDLGITANVAAKAGDIGFSIGGKFEEIKRRKWKFDVEFWT
jgi:hypothetical protein